MPDVTFFGDNVPRDRVNTIYELLSQSDSLLVAGSSLYVSYLGYNGCFTTGLECLSFNLFCYIMLCSLLDTCSVSL